MLNTFKRAGCLAVLFLVLVLGGCADFTAGPAPLERTTDPELVKAHARLGRVYCTRGWLGIFSTGMMELADRIDQQEGITSVSIADMEYPRLQEWIIAEHKAGKFGNEPLVLLGHSYGADDMIRVSERLKAENITVDLLVLIDPVTPPAVPNNVKRVYCVYKSRPLTDWYPAWRGVPASVQDPATPLVNVDLRTAEVEFDTTDVSHPQIDKVVGVQNMAIEQIRKICLPRPGWQPPKEGTAATTAPKPPAP